MADRQSTPAVRELRPGVYQFPGQGAAANAYLIRGRRRNLLIDPGMPDNLAYLEQCLTELGLCVRDIHQVLLTHEHVDHVGCTPHFSATACVMAHSLAACKIVLQDDFVLMQRTFGVDRQGFHVDVCLESQSSIELGNYRLRVLHTPGHSSGSICLHEPEHGFVLTGDTLMAGGVLSVIAASGNVSDYIRSLELLASLRLTETYPGHGQISRDPHADCRAVLAKAHQLLEDSRTLFDTVQARNDRKHLFLYAKNLNR